MFQESAQTYQSEAQEYERRAISAKIDETKAREAQNLAQLDLKKSRLKLVLSEIKLKTARSRVLFNKGQELDALLEALRAGVQLQNTSPSIWAEENTGNLVLWSLQQSIYGIREKNMFNVHVDSLDEMRFALNGKEIELISKSETQKWNVNGSKVSSLPASNNNSYNNNSYNNNSSKEILFSPNGKISAKILDNNIEIRDRSTFQHLIKAYPERVEKIAFSPKSNIIAALGNTDITGGSGWYIPPAYAIRFWHLDKNFIQNDIKGNGLINDFQFFPSSDSIVSADQNGLIQTWDLYGQQTSSWQSYQGSIKNLSVSPDGNTVATYSSNGIIKIWNLFGNHNPKFLDEILSTMQNKFISYDSMGNLYSRLKYEYSTTSSNFNGELLASFNSDGDVKLFHQGKEIKSFMGLRLEQGYSNHCVFSYDGRMLICISKEAKIWRIDGREIILPIQVKKNNIQTATFNKSSTLIALGGKNSIDILDFEGRLLQNLKLDYKPHCLSFSSDNKLAIFDDGEKIIQIRSIAGSPWV